MVRNPEPLRATAAETELVLERLPDGERLSLRHLPTGVLFQGRPGPLWRVGLEDADGGERVVTSAESVFFDWRAVDYPGELSYKLLWSGPVVNAEGKLVIDRRTGVSYWKLEVRADPAGARVAWLEFPIVRVSCDAFPQSFALPELAGLLVRDPLERLGHYRNTYPGNLTMQFVDYGAGGAGLYHASTDTEGYLKTFEVAAEEGEIRLGFRHEPPVEPGQGRYAMPYTMALGTHAGDWQEAAMIYRTWGSKQPWARRRALPKWLREIDLWVWNRGPSASVLPGALELAKRLDAKVALDWYWWHKCAYDVGFPDYFPPREGDESFWRGVEEAHLAGVRIQPYVNGRLWGTKTLSWGRENAFRAACKNREGEPYAEVYNPFVKGEMAVMCPATEMWREKVAGIVERLVKDYEVDGVYLDCIGIAPPRPCYDPGHGHPLGAGNHWALGYRKMLEELRARLAERKLSVMLSTESCVEFYLDLFDAVLNVDASMERYGWLQASFGDAWEAIPLFAAVYHETAVGFGSATPLIPKTLRDPLWNAPPPVVDPNARLGTEQAVLELARNFVWGGQMLLANVTADELDTQSGQEILRFLDKLIHTRRENRRFLLDGSWEGVPDIECERVEIGCPVNWLYAREGPAPVNVRGVPAVLGSAWSDSSGESALFLVNITDRECRVRVRWRDFSRDILVGARDCVAHVFAPV